VADRGDDVSATNTALLFDLDGTLVDTDHVHLAAFQSVFSQHGVTLDRARFNAEVMGASNDAIGSAFLSHLSVSERRRELDRKEEIYRAEVGAVTPIAGVVELLDHCDWLGLKCGVVTNAPRANAELIIGALGLSARFPFIVCGPELPRGKPDPLPYLRGLELTGAKARCSLAFEDSLSGVRAAAAAGLTVIGLTTSLDEDRLIGAGAAFAVKDFRDARVYEMLERRLAA
jgi:HAD superfamily hydrolase (TIGR01509 family)